MFLVLAIAQQLSGNPLGERDSPQWVKENAPGYKPEAFLF